MRDEDVIATPSGSGELRRGALGTAGIMFFVISAAAPLTSMAGGTPLAMLLGNGPGTAGAFVLLVLVILLFAVGYTTMARHVTNSGAFYAFAARGLGGVAGGVAAIIALLGYNAMQIGIFGMFGAATATWLQAALGVTVPWWACVYAAIAVIAMFGYRQVDFSARVLAVLVALEFAVVLILDAAIIISGGDAGPSLQPFHPTTVLGGSLGIALLFNFAAFVGIEATTIYGEEAVEPRKTIPRATYLSVLLIGGFYSFTTWCVTMGAGVDKLSGLLANMGDPTRLLFVLSERYVGGWLSQAMSILFISSLFAALLAFHNAVARYFFVLGREGLLPRPLGRTHDAYQSPHLGSMLQTAIATIVVMLFVTTDLDPVLALFSWLSGIGALAVMTLMALASFSVVQFFRRHPHLPEGRFSTTVAPVLAGVVLLAVVDLAVTHFDVLTGASPLLAILLPATVALAGLIGAAMAMRLRRTAPRVFAELGASRAL